MASDTTSGALPTAARLTFLAMVPVHLVVLVWGGFGHVVLATCGGWMIFAYVLFVGPVLFVCLAITTVLSFFRRERPRTLPVPQVVTLWVVWLGLIVFGTFLADFGDVEGSQCSVLGDTSEQIGLSNVLAASGLGVAGLAWVALTVLQAVGLARQGRTKHDPRMIAS
ncbi:hypothetical protein BCF74_11086 [Knoellia remsis]|uniref:Uncharacterized protein n=1 Tax=Knoellia remsis TaxID=407159 RepID=A0A2T0UN41_9MICO|nr:hypothetical protein [Knoellia remsis]PRY59349.1 hypothetical protein BCF74_11086 [Knoellia remsis]